MDRRHRLFSARLLRGGCAALALVLALPLTSEAGLFRRKRSKKPKTPVVAPAQLMGIVVEPLPDGLRLQIDCSSRVRFRWGTLPNSSDFYVEMEGAQIANALRHLLIGTGGVSEIRAEATGPSQVRVCLGLREGIKPRVERSDDGRSITLRIKSPDPLPGTAISPPPITPPAEQVRQLPRAPEPMPPVVPAVPAPGAASTRVTGIEVENLSAAEAVVHIQVQGRLNSCKSFRIKDPARLVVELAGAEHAALQPRFQGKGPLTLGSVWSAQFSREPLVTRVVIQLPQFGTPCKVEPPDASGDVRVRVGSAATATARPMPVGSGLRFRRGLHVGIDPGHGGSDPGALNERVGVYEKEITLDIARRLARILEEAGVRTSMTRRDDRRLHPNERIRFVSTGEADVFVSIHCDARANRPDFTGITTYHHGRSAEGRALGAAIQSRLPAATDLPDRGLRSDFTLYPGQGLYVLRYARMPAVLLECGYISHSPTARKMASPQFRQQVAQGIAEGLRKYWEDRAPRSVSAALPE